MAIRLGLLRLLFRQTLPATLLGVLTIGIYATVWPDIMTWRDWLPPLLILGHCLLLAALLGRFQTPAFAYLYSRGYSRDALWINMMLVSALSILLAWLAGAMGLWTGLRSHIHDQWLQDPYFPLMARREVFVPFAWLAMAMLIMPACHYAWIRMAQPTRGRFGGFWATFALLVALLVLFVQLRHIDGWLAWLIGAALAVIWFALVVGGWTLHRRLEVQS